MNATLARKLRFSDAAYAINTTPKTLRNWLQRGVVNIHTPQQEGGWTEYSFIDIAILALVRSLVSWGVSVPTASNIANKIMTDFFPDLLRLKDPENMPAGVLASIWSNQRLHLVQEGDDWRIRHVALYDSKIDSIRNKGFNPGLPSGIAALRREIEPAPVFLTIDVETILRTAFERANESVNEGQDDQE
ncbi:MerR family transcriptional regulator [Bradyrhizobium sp. 6(2017)]|uniref:MerR family transcriptional regulator n=1 Tax=Bradyrhizobium sp. 6(2017) TaxID=1197460 RepID=UPI0013E1B2EC|nr:MerR family transcriptional regulator [Bradyrhizobium sp. 6(2017)]QIG92878.1 MerR family transcriptional regulator [Bradyrhizobium sp. 6(2017)]